MGKSSRDKGARVEREMVKLLHGKRIKGRILTARRVPLSGSMGTFKGDVLVGEMDYGHPSLFADPKKPQQCPRCSAMDTDFIGGTVNNSEEKFEVKARNLDSKTDQTGTAMKQLYRLMEDNFGLLLKGDRKDALVVLRIKDWIE